MGYDEAHGSMITTRSAINEIKSHGMLAKVSGDQLVELGTMDHIANINQAGMVKGGDVLDWLGY